MAPSRTVEMLGEYEPAAYIGRISPTPLLMVVARQDHLTPAHLAIDAYERARAGSVEEHALDRLDGDA